MKKLIVIVGVLIAIVALFLVGLRIYTKSFSPQDTATFEGANTQLSIDYSRPYKMDRKIFGGLVPYNEVWRTGANEATIFTTSTDLLIGGQILNAGSYSVFTIPAKEGWTVIFNKEIGQWGIEIFSGQANRDPEYDALITEVSTIHTTNTFEQFTISFERIGEEIEMILMWDQTLIVIPMFTNS